MKICQNCNCENSDNNKFCVKCGTKLIEQPKFCPECGSKIINSPKFCTACGFKLLENITEVNNYSGRNVAFEQKNHSTNENSDINNFNLNQSNFQGNHIDLVSPMIEVPGENIYMLASPVTQKLYESIMERNPSHFQDNKMNPVENVSWYKAICFCNYLSMIDEKEPVYNINGMTDPNEWSFEYYDHPLYAKGITHMEYDGVSLIEMNEYADGYRLPTYDEWGAAVDDSADDGWAPYGGSGHIYDPSGCTHPVMQKEPNSFGFYDLYGNVWEWVWDTDPDDPYAHYFRGNSWRTTFSNIYHSGTYRAWKRKKTLGFRVVCRKE